MVCYISSFVTKRRIKVTHRERVCILQTKKESCVTGCGCFVFDFVKNLDALERQPLYHIFRLLKKKQLFFSVLPPWPLWLRHWPVHLILHCTTANRITKEIRTILNPTFEKKKKNLTCTLSLVICVCLTEKKTLVDVCAASLEAHREIKKSIVNFFFKYFVVLLLLLTSFCPTGVFSTGREAFLAPTHLSRKKKKIFATRIKVSLFLPPVGTFFLEVNKSGK